MIYFKNIWKNIRFRFQIVGVFKNVVSKMFVNGGGGRFKNRNYFWRILSKFRSTLILHTD